MKPTAEQGHQALMNFYQPLRSPGGKLKDARERVKHSKEKASPEGLAQIDIFSQMDGVTSAGRRRNPNVRDSKYNPVR